MSGHCHECGHTLCVCDGQDYQGWFCDKCDEALQIGAWPWCPHGQPNIAVIDDQIEGGPRLFDTMGHEDVWIESKSQWKREVAARELVHVDRHDRPYYDRHRRQHMEMLRDTGQL